MNAKFQIRFLPHVSVITLLLFATTHLCSVAQPPINWDDSDVIPGTVIIKYRPSADVYAEAPPPPPAFQGGTLLLPDSLNKAIDDVPVNGIIGLVRTVGNTNYIAPDTISKPCTLIAVGGVATISR